MRKSGPFTPGLRWIYAFVSEDGEFEVLGTTNHPDGNAGDIVRQKLCPHLDREERDAMIQVILDKRVVMTRDERDAWKEEWIERLRAVGHGLYGNAALSVCSEPRGR